MPGLKRVVHRSACGQRHEVRDEVHSYEEPPPPACLDILRLRPRSSEDRACDTKRGGEVIMRIPTRTPAAAILLCVRV